MSNDRYYLTSDDIRQQQRINRAVAELIDPAPVVNRRRSFGGDGPVASVRYQFQCEVVKQEDEHGELTDHIRVFTEIDTWVHLAGWITYPSNSNYYLVSVQEQYVPIPEEIEPQAEGSTAPSGYIYLTFNNSSPAFAVLAAPPRYVNELYIQFRQLAMIRCTAQEQEDDEEPVLTYTAEQTIFPLEPVNFNHWYLNDSAYYPKVLDPYMTTAETDYSAQKLVISANTSTLKPSVTWPSGSYPLPAMTYPDPDLEKDQQFPVSPQDGKLPVLTVLYLATDTYACAGEFVSAVVSCVQVNFQGRMFTASALVSNRGYTALNKVGRCVFDWSGYPVYPIFQVEFTFTRERVQTDATHVQISDTATGIRIFNPYEPSSEYAGYVMYWSAPAAEFLWAEMTPAQGTKTVYLTITWDEEEEENPTIAYSFDISQIDPAKTWTKVIAWIYGSGTAADPWRLEMNPNRDFTIYGRWV